MDRQIDSVWQKIRAHLASKRDRINEQIGCYPTPIAGCDQQFNYLLEQRTGISGEWDRMNEAENESLISADPIQVVEEFIRSSTYMDTEAKEPIRRFAKQ